MFLLGKGMYQVKLWKQGNSSLLCIRPLAWSLSLFLRSKHIFQDRLYNLQQLWQLLSRCRYPQHKETLLGSLFLMGNNDQEGSKGQVHKLLNLQTGMACLQDNRYKRTKWCFLYWSYKFQLDKQLGTWIHLHNSGLLDNLNSPLQLQLNSQQYIFQLRM
jgi:hypothetical protein